MTHRVFSGFLGKHLEQIVLVVGRIGDVLCSHVDASLLGSCLELSWVLDRIFGDGVVLALSGGDRRVEDLWLLGFLLGNFLIRFVDFLFGLVDFLISDLLSHIHQSNAEKILTPLLSWDGLRSRSSETNAPNTVILGSLNKQPISSIHQSLLELLILGKLEVIATFHNAKFDWIPNCVTEGLDASTQCLLILRGLCDENLSGDVWIVEGLGLAVHHVLFGGVELDVRVVGVGEGAFLPLREDAVDAISYAEKVDGLRGTVGSSGSHGVDVV